MKKLHQAIQEFNFWKNWDKNHNQKIDTFIVYSEYYYVNKSGKLKKYQGYSVVRHFNKSVCSKFYEIVL